MTLVTKMIIAGGIAIAAVAGFALYKGSRFSVEQIPYSVEVSDGAFDLRMYPAISVAAAEARTSDGSDSFMALFGFISGANARNEKIPMTSPVLMDGLSTTGRKMSFALPAELTDRGVPAPSSGAVTTSTRPPARFATYRFSGAASGEAERAAVQSLREWIEKRGLIAEGEPVIAYYDAPFVPPPLRRNEAMLRIRP